MRVARGIAGATVPEQDGCFVCRGESELDWFIRMNDTGGPVDVWEVEGVDPASLVESPEGYEYLPGTVSRDRLRLIRQAVEPQP